MTEPTLTPITDNTALASAVEKLTGAPFITVDTEFLRESTYWPILCLIQVASEDDVFLIDPLAKGLDLAPFYTLLADTRTVKVFHAARQDVEIFHHEGGVIPAPLFDSQVAAMVCGFGEQVSYENLVNRVAKASVDKSSRFTDWSRRPLNAKQLAYAAGDVTHLRDIYKALTAQLEDSGRIEWVSEEMATLTNPDTYVTEPEDAWKRLKPRARKPRELAILQHVAAWRESQAQTGNVPRSRILKDDAIYEIALQAPKDKAALSRLRAVPRGWENSRAAGGLLEAIHAALAIPDEDLPKIKKTKAVPEGTGPAVDLLRVLLKQVCEAEGVAAKLVASSSDLEQIAIHGEDAEVDALSGWRRTLFGDLALKLLRGELALSFKDRTIAIVPTEAATDPGA